MRSLIIVISLLLVTGCEWRMSRKPSYLVIAVESLGSEAFFCGESDAEYAEGLGAICNDGIRFTHAYTPSTLSQSALASILTGMYPKDHGVWHNGSQFLSEKFLTVPEVAFQHGYRTSFFSGGPPIWRKSGFEQGFELFEDNLSINWREIYRPVARNFELFLNWFNEFQDGRPFFSMIYLPDLEFSQKVTVNDLGVERAKGYDSQLKEINESLATLFNKMKQMGIWDNTFIFIVGLNGRVSTVNTEIPESLVLKSEKTQVALLIKPARKARDEGIEWTIDANVTLVDLGATFDSPENLNSKDSQLDVSSIKNALYSPNVDWDKNRFILLESAWANWRAVGETRFALRQEHMLYINDIKPQIYNSLTDRFEAQPISSHETTIREFVAGAKSFFTARSISPWAHQLQAHTEKMMIVKDQINANASTEELRGRLFHQIKQRPWDKQLVGWQARYALEEKDWEALDKLGNENIQPIWSYVAKRNMGIDGPAPIDVCWALINKLKKNNVKTSSCEDKEFLAFVDWAKSTNANLKIENEERFMRAYALAGVDEEIALYNFYNSLNWDVAVDSPGEPRLVQLALALPEYKGFRQVVAKRFKRP
jgi:Sulfatase